MISNSHIHEMLISKKGPFTQFFYVSKGRLCLHFNLENHIIFEGIYARGDNKQLAKLAKCFKYEVLPRPQLKHVNYTSLRGKLANLFN